MADREVAQAGSAPGLGPGGRRFESCLPDHILKPALVAGFTFRTIPAFLQFILIQYMRDSNLVKFCFYFHILLYEVSGRK